MLKEIISLLPKNSSIKIYKNGNPILKNGDIIDTQAFAKLFADVEVKQIYAVYFDNYGIVYMIEIGEAAK